MTEGAEEWLWGWDPTPGIVSVWAEPDGRALVWRRLPRTGGLVVEEERYRPWMLLASLADLRHLGARLVPEHASLAPGRAAAPHATFEELSGPGALRWLVRAPDARWLARAILHGASRRLGRPLRHVRELGAGAVLAMPPEEQYLVATGRTHFRDLTFDDLRRVHLDLETTGLDPSTDRIFLAALRDPDGNAHLLEAGAADSHGRANTDPHGRAQTDSHGRAHADSRGYERADSHGRERADSHGHDGADSHGRPPDPADAAEAELIRRIVAAIQAFDPDVIENHNLHGFDLPFLAHRARILGVPLVLGRTGEPGLRRRPAARGAAPPRAVSPPEGPSADVANRVPEPMRRARFTVPGRELIDTLDAVLRHDFSSRDLPGHGLKVVARHMGLARAEREHIPGGRVHEVYRTDPERVRRYAADDVHEAAGLGRLLGGAAFALARMAPRRYERLADAGPATGVLEPLLVRAYLRSGVALPAHEPGDGTSHSGAALHLFATGVAHRVVKADVASLYPSLMRQYRIGPRRDRLGVLLALVDQLVEQRLSAKARARALPPGTPERHTHEALSAAMKIVVNSAYGYLGAVGLTRFADVHAANEVTRRGREVLGLLCRELSARGTTLLQADTDGVYFAVPAAWTEADERRVVAEVASLLPERVRLEFDGRYAAMLSHEPKNYALQSYSGDIVLRGVAFRSSRAEPFGEAFLRRALACLFAGDVAGVREVHAELVTSLRRRAVPTSEVTARVRLTKSHAHYVSTRDRRRELPYEAALSGGKGRWIPGERVRVYRAAGGRAGLLPDRDEDDLAPAPPAGSAPVAGAPLPGPPLAGAPRAGAPFAGAAPSAPSAADPRDYDVEHYVRVLRDTFAARLSRALTPDDFAAAFADPEQPSLFTPSLAPARPILTVLPDPLSVDV